jgi:hypothetical protein
MWDGGQWTVSADFEPPKYIASLIGAINDAAKSAQTSALFLLALGSTSLPR